MPKFGPDANVQPMPNPKPMSVLRVTLEVRGGDDASYKDAGLIRNANVFPKDLIRR